MTTGTQQTDSRRWLLPFLAAMVAALAAILLGTTASASAPVGAETRVGAFNVAGEVPVGPPERITAGQRLGNSVAGPDFVVATGVAANAAASTSRYTRTTFGGNRVYQRNDLIDPSAVDKLGRSNLERMQAGIAPLGPDGRSINLHHLTQRPNGAIAEVTATMHQTNSRVLHINPNTIPSGIDRGAFDAWRRSYWMSRAGDF